MNNTSKDLELYEEPSLLSKVAVRLFQAGCICVTGLALYVLTVIFLSMGV